MIEVYEYHPPKKCRLCDFVSRPCYEDIRWRCNNAIELFGLVADRVIHKDGHCECFSWNGDDE